jgi:hypothetical protein
VVYWDYNPDAPEGKRLGGGVGLPDVADPVLAADAPNLAIPDTHLRSTASALASADLVASISTTRIRKFDGDRVMWLHDLAKVPVGDADLSGSFTSDDLATVFTSGLYETGSLATWVQGDWNGDLVFDSNDFVAAFIDGYYEQQDPLAGVAAVPEPSTTLLTVLGILTLAGWIRRR